MKTRYFRADSDDESFYGECAKIIRGGGLVAFPTETVYGLGANGLDPEAAYANMPTMPSYSLGVNVSF